MRFWSRIAASILLFSAYLLPSANGAVSRGSSLAVRFLCPPNAQFSATSARLAVAGSSPSPQRKQLLSTNAASTVPRFCHSRSPRRWCGWSGWLRHSSAPPGWWSHVTCTGLHWLGFPRNWGKMLSLNGYRPLQARSGARHCRPQRYATVVAALLSPASLSASPAQPTQVAMVRVFLQMLPSVYAVIVLSVTG